MSRRFAGHIAVLGALAIALAVVGAASASASKASLVRGVVVHANRRAHSFVVASGAGKLVAIHAAKSPKAGSVVAVSAVALRNGTYGAQRIVVHSRITRTRIRGVVTFVDRRRGLFTVSADGASLLVHPTHAAKAAADTTPSVGQDVSVEVEIDDQGNLTDQGVQQTGTQTANIDLEGTILAIDPTKRTLSISADDSEESGQSLTLVVPQTIDISTFTVGDDVELTVTMQTDGTFLLQGASGDANQQQANNPSDQQGCQADERDNSSDAGSPNTAACQAGATGATGTTSATGSIDDQGDGGND